MSATTFPALIPSASMISWGFSHLSRAFQSSCACAATRTHKIKVTESKNLLIWRDTGCIGNSLLGARTRHGTPQEIRRRRFGIDSWRERNAGCVAQTILTALEPRAIARKLHT